MRDFTRVGKQVLMNSDHMCDASSETNAMIILNALRGMEEMANAPVPRKVSAPINLNTCQVMQQGDEMACACGLRWDMDDDNPPLCIHRAPR